MSDGGETTITETAQGQEVPPVVSPLAERLMTEQPFKGYELAICLSSSDVGAVFKARDKTMERNVVLKAVQPSANRVGAVEDFFSQAGAVARVRHPGVARGLDAGRGGDVFFMVHETARGESLETRLARRLTRRLTERESLVLARDVAGVLQALFELGQYHGDLAPDRIAIGEGGTPTLLGLGFTWNVAWPDDRQAYLSRPYFLPPERIAGEFNIDIRGDLYALGCVWGLALLGEPVFKGTTPAQVLDMHLEAKPTPPRETDPRLSSATSQLVMWLLEKDRDARPRTPKEFLRKLAAHPLLDGAEEEAGGRSESADERGEP